MMENPISHEMLVRALHRQDPQRAREIVLLEQARIEREALVEALAEAGATRSRWIGVRARVARWLQALALRLDPHRESPAAPTYDDAGRDTVAARG
jgi:hypothetical protein